MNSKHLNKQMELCVYGHYGYVILLFPTFDDHYSENDQEGLVESIAHDIDSGKCKVCAVSGVNSESWLNDDLSPVQKSERHFQYNNHIIEEIVPYIFRDCGGPVPIVTCGASIGAYHAVNKYLRRPDIFYGAIGMSGTYDIYHYTGGYFDENCYFNSPVHYLPNLNDNYWLSFLRNKKHLHLMTGSGMNENAYNSILLGEILEAKSIPCEVDIWGNEFGHNWETWKQMLPNIISNRF